MLSGKANDLLVGQAYGVIYADQREGTLEAKLSHNLAPIISLASVMPCPVIFAVAVLSIHFTTEVTETSEET
jgi:predicted transporter